MWKKKESFPFPVEGKPTYIKMLQYHVLMRGWWIQTDMQGLFYTRGRILNVGQKVQNWSHVTENLLPQTCGGF